MHGKIGSLKSLRLRSHLTGASEITPVDLQKGRLQTVPLSQQSMLCAETVEAERIERSWRAGQLDGGEDSICPSCRGKGILSFNLLHLSS